MSINTTPKKSRKSDLVEIETTPKRPRRSLRNIVTSPRNPNCCSLCSEPNSPQESQRSIRSPRAKRISQNLFSKEAVKETTIKTKVFYKPNTHYINPLERKVLGRPKVNPPIVSNLKKNKLNTKNKAVKKNVKIKKKTGTSKRNIKVGKNVSIKPYVRAKKVVKNSKLQKNAKSSSKKVVKYQSASKMKKTKPKSPKKSLIQSPKKSPKKSSTNSPKKSPKKSSTYSPIKSPKKSLIQSPKKSPKKSSTNSPKKSPKKSLINSPRKSLVNSPRKSLVNSPKAQVSPRKTSGKLSPKKVTVLTSPKKRENLSPKRLTQAASPSRTPRVTTPNKSKKTTPRKSALVPSPKKSPKKVSSPRKTSPQKSPSKRVTPRRFFTRNRPVSTPKIEAKKWVAQLSKGGKLKTPKSAKPAVKSKSVSTRKRKSLETEINNVPNKKPKIAIEKEYIAQVRVKEEITTNPLENMDASVDSTSDVPLKENNTCSPRRTRSETPSPGKVTEKDTSLEEVEVKDTAGELLKENNIPEGDTSKDSDIDIPTESPKPVKLFPIFSKAVKISKSPKSVKKNEPLSPTKERLKSLKKFHTKDDTSGLKQAVIDAGQKEIGGKICPTCNMIFTLGAYEDEELHARYHNKFLQSLRFSGWKSERVVGEYGDGRIVMVNPEDQNHKIRKIEEIRTFVDECLGYPSVAIPNNTSVYFLYICKQKVVGCLIAQEIKLAYRVLPPKDNQPELNYDSIYCSTDAVPALCGVSRIWTAPKYRRRKIATRLLDSLRCNFIFGHYLAINDIAFSDPSPAGRMLAANYMKCNTFLVYK